MHSIYLDYCSKKTDLDADILFILKSFYDKIKVGEKRKSAAFNTGSNEEIKKRIKSNSS